MPHGCKGISQDLDSSGIVLTLYDFSTIAAWLHGTSNQYNSSNR